MADTAVKIIYLDAVFVNCWRCGKEVPFEYSLPLDDDGRLVMPWEPEENTTGGFGCCKSCYDWHAALTPPTDKDA